MSLCLSGAMWARKHFALLLVLASVTATATAAVLVATAPPTTGLVPFQSYAELKSYVDGARSSEGSTAANAGLIGGPASSPTPSPVMGPAPGSSGPSYSGTNVQVAGVDELDMVKTDGAYLYIASQGTVAVILAYPASDLHVVSRISLGNLTEPLIGTNATYAVGLFLDGSQLLVVGEAFSYREDMYGGPVPIGAPIAAPAAIAMPVAPSQTFGFLFDVSNPAAPVLEHTATISGTVSTGRLVGSTAYLVATAWIMDVNGTYAPPRLCVDGTCRDLTPDEIYRDPQSVDAWDYTNILAMDLVSGAAKPISVITGGLSTLYMSPSAMYLAFYKWAVSPMATTGMMPAAVDPGWTTIYKLGASGLDVTPVASANVAGSLLNQYSMDESGGMLRVATTVRSWTSDGDTSSTYSNIYVFDGSLALLGAVKNLSPGESIFAVRFLGDRAYVVTFRRIDPLYVVDLSDPTSPRVSGYLEMPGFSSYLYPLDAGHLLGVGKDALPAEGNWSWYQGLKVSLYDVTDGSRPNETANVTIGDRGTQSEVLNDPHAFLYIPDRQLVVLPVDLAIVDPSQYPGGVPAYAWGSIVWEGAYLYRVNETTGFTYVGRIAHDNGTVNATCGWYGSPKEILRSVYIGGVLYTISNSEVLASSLADLSEIASVVYGPAPYAGYGCPVPLL